MLLTALLLTRHVFFTRHLFCTRHLFLTYPILDRPTPARQAYAFTVPTFGEGIIYDADLDKRTEQV